MKVQKTDRRTLSEHLRTFGADDNDAIIVFPESGEPVMVIFRNEDVRAKTQGHLSGRFDSYEGFPCIFSKAQNLFKRLLKIDV